MRNDNNDTIYHNAYELFESKNYKKAFNTWLELANSGHPPSMLMVSSMYHVGEGVEKDNEKYIMWLEKSAQNGYDIALYQLGMYCLDNDMIEKGVKYIEESAKQNYPPAIHQIGLFYYDDYDKIISYPKDNDKAMAIWKTSYELGYGASANGFFSIYKKKYGRIKSIWFILTHFVWFIKSSRAVDRNKEKYERY
jgi:TPR repeat protein